MNRDDLTEKAVRALVNPWLWAAVTLLGNPLWMLNGHGDLTRDQIQLDGAFHGFGLAMLIAIAVAREYTNELRAELAEPPTIVSDDVIAEAALLKPGDEATVKLPVTFVGFTDDGRPKLRLGVASEAE